MAEITEIAELKNYLSITWDDEKTDLKLSHIIDNAKNILANYAGTSVDFSKGHIKQLLYDCCRYIWNDSYEDFKINFFGELLALRTEFSVKADNDE